MVGYEHRPTAVTVVGYAGVVYAAVAVFAVTLFGSSALSNGAHGYSFPVQHWMLAAGATVVVVALVLSALHMLLRDFATAPRP